MKIEIDDYPDVLPGEVSTAAFRIFQESLTNIARHAAARSITFQFQNQGQRVEARRSMTTARASSPAELENPKSLGIIGMLERAQDVGGQVVFRRSPASGTDVVLTIPFAK